MSGLPLLVAAGQAEARSGDVEANVATAVDLLAEATGRRARLLVLPEAFLTGYDEAALTGPAVPAPHDLPGLLEPLCRAARATEAVVVLSTPLRRGGREGAVTTMTSVVVHPDGTVAAPYDKQHLDETERAWLVPGDHGASVVLDDVEMGLALCYDTSFPEHARHAADAGASAYLVSAAFFPGSERRRDTVLAARALDHGFYVVAACATGTTATQTFVGGTSIWGPEGDPLASLGTEEGVVVAAVDPRELAAVRARRTMAADRRRDLGPRETTGGV